MEIAEMILTALLSFAALFFLTKLIGCRQVSQLSLFDYINGITIGSLDADLAIAGPGQRLAPLIGMMIYAGATFILSLLTDKSIAARRVIEGRPLVLLEHDRLKEENFARARIDLGEFLMRARVAGYFDLSQLSAAVLEPNGMISFLPKGEYRPATPGDLSMQAAKEGLSMAVILDGTVREEALHRFGFDMTWLLRELKRHRVGGVKDVFLAVCTPDGVLTVYPRQKNRK